MKKNTPAAASALHLGPVLSFRGLSADGKQWKVSALIGVDAAAPDPRVNIDGRSAGAPVELLAHGGHRYLRYDLSCPVKARERRVPFGIANGPQWTFTVPAKGQAPRMAYVSCNGFSDPSGMRKLVRPQNAVWEDFLYNHDRQLRGGDLLLDKEQLWHETHVHEQGVQRFHLLLMGGDQLYLDSIWEDIKELKEWVSKSRKEQLAFEVSEALDRTIEAYYFSLYAQRWLPDGRPGWNESRPVRDAADAMARTPTVMMWDDHDIFDGWGSYSCEMQQSPLFKTLFRHARRAFWVFQLQHALTDLPQLVDATPPGFTVQDPMYRPIDWKATLASDPLALPLLNGQPGFSSAYRLGPVALVVADLRSERSRGQVLGTDTWSALKHWLDTPDRSPQTCRHLIFMSSVPVIHPKLSLAEGLLDTFGQDHVLDSNADDLKDHWSHDDHEGERKRLLETLALLSKDRKVRVTIVSGDVHVAACGVAYRRDATAAIWPPIQQLTSSGVVHPSLMGVAERLFLFMLNGIAEKVQFIDAQYAAEMNLFPNHNKHIMPARNWLALECDATPGAAPKLWASWRCEGEAGFSNHLQAIAAVE